MDGRVDWWTDGMFSREVSANDDCHQKICHFKDYCNLMSWIVQLKYLFLTIVHTYTICVYCLVYIMILLPFFNLRAFE